MPEASSQSRHSFGELDGILLVGSILKLGHSELKKVFTPDVVKTVAFWRQGYTPVFSEAKTSQEKHREEIVFVCMNGTMFNGFMPLTANDKINLSEVVTQTIRFLRLNLRAEYLGNFKAETIEYLRECCAGFNPGDISVEVVDISHETGELLSKETVDKLVNKLVTDGSFRASLTPAQGDQVIRKLGEVTGRHYDLPADPMEPK